MHMSDALISPAVGGAMWAASAGLAAWSAHKVKQEVAENRTPLMGTIGAFVFAAQMITFAIPLTGSSGHLGGGLLLAILLGPHAAFLVMFSILAVQALFFADGGLLALGCNVFNLGFWPCFVAYPLLFRNIVADQPGRGRLIFGATLAGVIGLQLGAFGVVLETLLSGRSELSFGTFALFMQPIHLAIGVVEGLVTAALVSFVRKARPELLAPSAARPVSVRPVLVAFAVGALAVGGGFSWLASARPDGLEWAMAKVRGEEELAAPAGGVHERLAAVQDRTAVMPDYGFRAAAGKPAGRAGASLAGLLGGALVLALAGAIGLSLRFARRPE